MTHDELLAKIALHWIYADDPEFYGIGGYRKALRAVVELHKPTKNRSIEGWCDVCTDYYQYPCPTIQAIEKELK